MELGLRRDECAFSSFLFFYFLLVLLPFSLSPYFNFLFPRFMERFSLSLVGGNTEQKIQGDYRLWDTMLEEREGGGLASLELFLPAVSKNSYQI